LMTIPNVFGPFCKPNYNSVVATFCHKLANQQQPIILSDKQVDLIYVGDLVREMYRLALIVNGQKVRKVTITPSVTRSVTDISAQLSYFKTTYLQNGVFPSLSQQFDRDLFNTFRCYISDDHYPVKLKRNTDNRGTFIEITRAESAGQFSYSTTMPGITRGNHFHTRKAEQLFNYKRWAAIT
jgi:UDP-2-acetamido-2,6-beta-L-arabino-hexul-4-ose reductase